MNIKKQPSRISATQWGKTVTIEVEHSDTDLYEFMEMFKGVVVGLEYSESSWRSVIKELGALYEEEDIDEALSEHNRDEEDIELWDTTNTDGGQKVEQTNL
jgi:hypothetical protein